MNGMPVARAGCVPPGAHVCRGLGLPGLARFLSDPRAPVWKWKRRRPAMGRHLLASPGALPPDPAHEKAAGSPETGLLRQGAVAPAKEMSVCGDVGLCAPVPPVGRSGQIGGSGLTKPGTCARCLRPARSLLARSLLARSLLARSLLARSLLACPAPLRALPFPSLAAGDAARCVGAFLLFRPRIGSAPDEKFQLGSEQ